MIKSRAILGAVLAVMLTAMITGGLAQGGTRSGESDHVTNMRDLTLELVGQVQNSPPGVSPATSIQYGYLSHLNGLSVFGAEPPSESTALFTFYTDTTTIRVINNGPIRVISREGTVTIYRDPAANGNFADPDSFRDGTPVLVAKLRQQVILDTAAGQFTTQNLNTITSTSPLESASGTVKLGKTGDQFRTILSGRVNATPPPAAHIAGYAYSVPKHPAKL